jgi:hypothetical protein
MGWTGLIGSRDDTGGGSLKKFLTDPSPPFFQGNEQLPMDLPHFSLPHGFIGNSSLRKESQYLRKQDLPRPFLNL